MFSVLNGGLVSYKYAGKEMIEAIPKPNFWRAPTDNDCGNLMQMRYAQWKVASMYLSHKEYRKGAYGPSNSPQTEETVLPHTPYNRSYFTGTSASAEILLCFLSFLKENGKGKGRAATGESVTSHASIRQKPWRAFVG